MRIDFSKFTDYEIETFFEYGITPKKLKEIFKNNQSFSKKIKGFRPQSIPTEIINKTSLSLIRHENNIVFIRCLNSIYDNILNHIDDLKGKYVSQGYDETMAFAMAVKNGITDNFRPLYYKIENISEERQKVVEANYALLKLIKNEAERL